MDKDVAVINAKLDSITTDIGEIKTDVRELKVNAVSRRELNEVKENIRNKVNKKEFEIVKALVFGFASMVLIAFLGGLISLVFTK